MPELTSYGEYIVNLFSVTHSSIHTRVIAFDKAVRKRVGSVRNLELWDFEKFANLKIAHMDLIGVSVVSGSSKDDSGQKGKKGKIGRRTNLATSGTTVNVTKRKRIAEGCMSATSME